MLRALPCGCREGAETHFSKLKRGKRMLFLMKMVKFSASIMTGLRARTGGRGRGNERCFRPRNHCFRWTPPNGHVVTALGLESEGQREGTVVGGRSWKRCFPEAPFLPQVDMTGGAHKTPGSSEMQSSP